MRKKKIYKIISLLLAGTIAFSTVDITALATDVVNYEEQSIQEMSEVFGVTDDASVSGNEGNAEQEKSSENDAQEVTEEGTEEENTKDISEVGAEELANENLDSEENSQESTEENEEAVEEDTEEMTEESVEETTEESGEEVPENSQEEVTEETEEEVEKSAEESEEENGKTAEDENTEDSEIESTVKISFDANGGEVCVGDMVIYADKMYENMPTPVRDGYLFEGWYTDPNGGKLLTEDMISALEGDIIVYAHWVVKDVAAPVMNIKTGELITEDTVLRLTTTTLDAQIYYTTDGTEPYTEGLGPTGKLYTDGIKAGKVMQDSDDPAESRKVVVIKAYAVKEGSYDSEIETFEYFIEAESTRWGDISEEDKLLFATETMPQGDASMVPQGMWIAGIKEEGYTYTGSNIVFTQGTEKEIRVYDGKTLLTLNKDYTISYKNNKNAYTLQEGDEGYIASKAPTITIKGKGNYTGDITKNFVIEPMSLAAIKGDGSKLFQAPDITLVSNNKVQKGTTKVTYVNEAGKTVTLKVNTDFTYVYPGTDEDANDYNPDAFKVADEYEVKVVGKGNYKDEIYFTETITNGILISKVKVSSIPAQNYQDGEEIKPGITLTYGGKPLTEYDEETGLGDYTLKYENNRYPGTASIIITGIGSYAGTRVVTFKINGIELKKAKMTGFNSSYIYTGNEIKQDEVKFSYAVDSENEPEDLVEGVHYNVEYLKNENIGTATVIYTGIPNKGWSGTIKKTYSIKAYDLNKDINQRIEVSYPQSVEFVKNGVMPKPIITYTPPIGEAYELQENVDYKLSYLNNKAVNDGTNPKKMPTIKITGKGNFTGTRQKENFVIEGSDISNLTMAASDVVYQKKAGKFTTKVVITDIDGKTLKAGSDYEKELKYYYDESVYLEDGTPRIADTEVSPQDIVPAGTVLKVVATGKGSYAGKGNEPATISGTYRVVGADIAKATVKVNKQYYTGKPICPDKSQIVITLKGKVLSKQDYKIVSYTNNVNKGTAKLTVKGVGEYGGTKTVNFTISNKSMYYIISFNANGATSGSMKDMQIKYGTSYNLTKNAYKRTGYDFKGWNEESDGTAAVWYEDQARDPIVISKEDIGKTLILYAQWKLSDYKINYNLNGGTNHEENPATYTIEDEVTFEDPTKEGAEFLGWYTDKKYSKAKQITSIAKGSTGDKTLYAKWKLNDYQIIYHLDGGTNHKDNPANFTVEDEVVLHDPVKDGYTFLGWYTDSEFAEDNKVTSISEGSVGDQELYARWELTDYNIIYHLNDGTNHEENPTTYTMEDEIVFQEPTKEGCDFVGWYTDSKFTESKKITSIAKGSQGDVEVYAKWKVTIIQDVEVPESYVNVLDYGATPDDETNDTKAIYDALFQAAVNAIQGRGANTVYVPAGVYKISPTDPYIADSGLYVWSDTNLVMNNDAVLEVEGVSSSSYCVIKCFKSKNITITGGQIRGERYQHIGKGGESGHGISILGCNNVTVSDISIASNWGDGIYLGTWYDSRTGVYTGNENISISHCEITDNRRNNVSIVDADTVLIDSCYIADAYGTAPQCGICIEPNKGSCSGDEICSDITIKDTTITAYQNKNAVNYWCFMTTANGSSPSAHPEYVTADRIRFENCTFNGYVGNYSGNNLTIDKDTVFNGTFVSWRDYTQEK